MPRVFIVFAGVAVTLVGAPDLAGATTPPAIRARTKHLIRIVRTDRSFKLRALAARRLGAVANEGARRDPKILRALVHCLSDHNEVVRGVCAQALGVHADPSTLPDLERLALADDDEVVRRSARRAADRIRPSRSLVATKRSRRLTVQLGRIEFAKDSNTQDVVEQELLRSIRSAVEDRIEPHRPAMMPREDPDLRIDVSVSRESIDAASGQDIRFEVRVVLVELPGSNLRTAAQAIASTRGARRSKKRMEKLEERIALEAVKRAVDEALVTLGERS